MKKSYSPSEKTNIQSCENARHHFSFSKKVSQLVFACGFLVCLGVPFSTAQAQTEPGAAARAILTWLNAQMFAVEEKTVALRASGKVVPGTNCESATGWKIGSESRIKLGIDDFSRSVNAVKQNKCLTNDINQIENRIQRLARETGRSELSCSLENVEYVTSIIDAAYFLKDALAEYATLTAADEERARASGTHPVQEFNRRYGYIPGALLSPDFSLITPEYQDDRKCPDPQSFFSFQQVKEQLESILYKLDEIKNMGNDFGKTATGFSSGKSSLFSDSSMDTMRNQGKYDARAWYSRNIQQPIDSVFFLEYDSKEKTPVAMTPEELPDFIKGMKDKVMIKRARTFCEITQPPENCPEPDEDATASALTNSINAFGGFNGDAPATPDEDDLLAQRKIPEIMTREAGYVDDAKDFMAFALPIIVNATDITPEISKAIEEPLILLPKKVDATRDFLQEAYDLLTRVCFRHGACK